MDDRFVLRIARNRVSGEFEFRIWAPESCVAAFFRSVAMFVT